MSFLKILNKLRPTTSGVSEAFHQSQRVALIERLNLEHQDMTQTSLDASLASAAGRHKPGYVSSVFIGTTTEITALSGMTTGALAYNTTLDELQIYNGTNWTTRTLFNKRQQFLAYKSAADQDVTATSIKLVMDEEDFDPAGVYDKTTNYRFTPAVVGYYHLGFRFSVLIPAAGVTAIAYIVRGGTTYFGATYQKNLHATDALLSTLVGSEIVYCSNPATDYFEVFGGTSSGSTKFYKSLAYSSFWGYRVA